MDEHLNKFPHMIFFFLPVFNSESRQQKCILKPVFICNGVDVMIFDSPFGAFRERKLNSGSAEAGRDPKGKCATKEGYSDHFQAEHFWVLNSFGLPRTLIFSIRVSNWKLAVCMLTEITLNCSH